jgi:hypothetical protein
MTARTAYGEVIDLPDDPTYLAMFRSLGLSLVDGSNLPEGTDAPAKIRGWHLTTTERAAKAVLVSTANPEIIIAPEFVAACDAAYPEISLQEGEAIEIMYVKGLSALELPA